MYSRTYNLLIVNAFNVNGRWVCGRRNDALHRHFKLLGVLPHSGALRPSGRDSSGRLVLSCPTPGCNCRVHLPR